MNSLIAIIQTLVDQILVFFEPILPVVVPLFQGIIGPVLSIYSIVQLFINDDIHPAHKEARHRIYFVDGLFLFNTSLQTFCVGFHHFFVKIQREKKGDVYIDPQRRRLLYGGGGSRPIGGRGLAGPGQIPLHGRAL